MKVRLTVDLDKLHVDETVEGRTEEDVVREFRRRLEKRAPFALRLVLRTLSDAALYRKVVELHNDRTRAQEPAPASAREFLDFAERAGYVTRLPD